MPDQAEFLRKMFNREDLPDNGTRIITFASGKGGVGKSIMAVNLAVLFSRNNKKVTILDADFGMANINVILGVLPEYNLYHVYKEKKSLNDIILNIDDNLDIIAGASGISQLADLSEIERERFIEELSTLNHNDYLIIDVGAGISPNVIDMIKASDETFIITTPEPTAVTDAYGIIKAIVSTGKKVKLNLIVNRAKSFQEAKIISHRIIDIAHQFLDININYSGFVFDDANIVRSIHKQNPMVISYPSSKASLCFEDIAGRILNNSIKGAKKSNLKNFFKKILRSEEKKVD